MNEISIDPKIESLVKKELKEFIEAQLSGILCLSEGEISEEVRHCLRECIKRGKSEKFPLIRDYIKRGNYYNYYKEAWFLDGGVRFYWGEETSCLNVLWAIASCPSDVAGKMVHESRLTDFSRLQEFARKMCGFSDLDAIEFGSDRNINMNRSYEGSKLSVSSVAIDKHYIYLSSDSENTFASVAFFANNMEEIKAQIRPACLKTVDRYRDYASVHEQFLKDFGVYFL